MALPQGYFPVVKPPDPEWLGTAYLTQYMGSVPIVTRDKSPTKTQVTYDSYIRVEAGDTHRVPSTYGAAWDTTFLFHSYSPVDEEAADNRDRAIALVCAATGLIIVGWYVVDVVNFVGGKRLTDPEVPANIVRYRGAVTWRVAGQPFTQ